MERNERLLWDGNWAMLILAQCSTQGFDIPIGSSR